MKFGETKPLYPKVVVCEYKPRFTDPMDSEKAELKRWERDRKIFKKEQTEIKKTIEFSEKEKTLISAFEKFCKIKTGISVNEFLKNKKLRTFIYFNSMSDNFQPEHEMCNEIEINGYIDTIKDNLSWFKHNISNDKTLLDLLKSIANGKIRLSIKGDSCFSSKKVKMFIKSLLDKMKLGLTKDEIAKELYSEESHAVIDYLKKMIGLK